MSLLVRSEMHRVELAAQPRWNSFASSESGITYATRMEGSCDGSVVNARRRRRPPTSILEDKEKRVAVEYLGRSEAADDLGRGARVGYAGSEGARDIEGGRGRRAAVGRRGIGEINVHWRRRHNGGRSIGMGGYVRVDAYICQCV